MYCLRVFTTFILVFVIQSSAFGFLEEAAAVKLRANESGQIVDLQQQTTTPIKGDVPLDLKVSAPAMVKLDGRIPVILIPIQAGQSEIKLNPPSYKEAAGQTAQKEISYLVSEIMMGIQVVQKEIQKKNYDQAMARLDEMQKKYPNVPFFDFIRGSILFLQGKKSKARKAVTRALEAHPNYQEGKDFLKAIGGASTEGGEDE
jgi:tetratricopeptide (TPR) repeat protein